MEGVRYFHAANPGGQGINMREVKDVNGRQWGEMFLSAAAQTMVKDGFIICILSQATYSLYGNQAL